MATSRGGLAARRWSWQWLLAVLIALTPLLSVAPTWVSRANAPAPGRAPAQGGQVLRSPPATQVDITVDGEPLAAPGTIDGGVAMAPVDVLVKAMGGSVVQARPSSAQVQLGGHVLNARASQSTIDVDGSPEAVAAAPELIHGQLYVPVRAMVSLAGYALDWLGQTATVAISTRPAPAAALPVPSAAPQRLAPPVAAADRRSTETPSPVIPYTATDLELIGRVIHGEADDQPLAARIGIAAVIVNRVRTPGFPKTIEGVIYAPGQFQAVGAPMFEAGPTPSDLTAAKDALYGDDPTGGALYFYVPELTDRSSWIFSTHTLVTLGVVRFSR